MKVSVITIFPEFFSGPLSVSIVQRAIAGGALEVKLVDLRDFTHDTHRTVDDAPFGGGAGMVMKIGPISEALDSLEDGRRIVLTPAGVPLGQAHLDRWSEEAHIVLLCGRYEGIDQRVADHLMHEEVSLGDFVVAGGEVAALAVIEGVARLLPDVLGNPDSITHESFRDGLLEEGQYTRPAEFQGWSVPDVLLSGDHAAVDRWRHEERRRRTALVRPDLIDALEGSDSNQ